MRVVVVGFAIGPRCKRDVRTNSGIASRSYATWFGQCAWQTRTTLQAIEASRDECKRICAIGVVWTKESVGYAVAKTTDFSKPFLGPRGAG